MSNGWGLNVMDMFYNTTPHIKARPAYKTRNRISTMTPPCFLYCPSNDVSFAHARCHHELCAVPNPFSEDVPTSLQSKREESQGRTAFRCHVLRNITILIFT